MNKLMHSGIVKSIKLKREAEKKIYLCIIKNVQPESHQCSNCEMVGRKKNLRGNTAQKKIFSEPN